MQITPQTQLYLVLNKLSPDQKTILKANIELLNRFYIGPDSVLVCSNDEPSALFTSIAKGVADLDNLTFVALNSTILGLVPPLGTMLPYERKTVFDK